MELYMCTANPLHFHSKFFPDFPQNISAHYLDFNCLLSFVTKPNKTNHKNIHTANDKMSPTHLL